MATKKATTYVESKTTATITRKTLVKETENHVFTVIGMDSETPSRIRGKITHKNGTHCGDFAVNGGTRKTLSVNLNMDCKSLLNDLLVMLDDIDNNRVVEVDEFTYVKAAKAAAEAEVTETPVVEE